MGYKDMKLLPIFLLLCGCTTIEYNISIPITENKQNTGNLYLQSKQISIQYKHTTFSIKHK